MQYKSSSNAYPSVANGYISVRGSSYLEVEADVASLNIGVTTQNKSLEKAKDENSNISNKLLKSLYDSGISTDNISTKNLTVTRNYDYTNYQLLSYSVTNLINVVLDDISNLGDVYSLAIENGANDNINIDFSLSNPTYHYNRALKKASQDAINKANLLSKNFSVKYNPIPYKIVETSSPLYSVMYSSSSNYSYPQEIEPGIVKINAEVEAVFATYSV